MLSRSASSLTLRVMTGRKFVTTNSQNTEPEMFSVKHHAWLLSVFFVGCSTTLSADVDFKRDIAPILEDRCWGCHGEDEQESGLRLDRRAFLLKGGDSGLAAVVPGKPDKSYLIEVVRHLDADVKMPPDEDQLPAKQIELLAAWVEEGAVWPGQMQEVAREKSDH